MGSLFYFFSLGLASKLSMYTWPLKTVYTSSDLFIYETEILFINYKPFIKLPYVNKKGAANFGFGWTILKTQFLCKKIIPKLSYCLD